jgi:hypothetical protein
MQFYKTTQILKYQTNKTIRFRIQRITRFLKIDFF